MSIIATRAALQALHLTVAGIKTAPTRYPVGQLNDGELPMTLVYPGRGQWFRPMASSPLIHLRTYRVLLFVKAIVQGVGNDEALQTLDALVQAFGQLYTTPENLILTSGTYKIYLRDGQGDITDTGTSVLTFGKIAYHGTEFTINVKETSA